MPHYHTIKFMAIRLTEAEKRRLKTEGSLIREIEDASGPETSTYHNIETGQEFYNLPTDPWSMERYYKRGWRLGPAPKALREKYRPAPAPAGLVASRQPVNEATNIEDVVQRAVINVFKKLGIPIPEEPEPVVAQEPIKPKQLQLF